MVMDCANGAASYIAPEVFSRLGAQVVAIHASPNGLNINVDAGSEHVRRSLEEMNLLIQHHQARFGLAFDGDADRVVFVDERGGLIDGDHMLGMLARYFDARGAAAGALGGDHGDAQQRAESARWKPPASRCTRRRWATNMSPTRSLSCAGRTRHNGLVGRGRRAGRAHPDRG